MFDKLLYSSFEIIGKRENVLFLSTEIVILLILLKDFINKYYFDHIRKLNGVGPVDNRLSTD